MFETPSNKNISKITFDQDFFTQNAQPKIDYKPQIVTGETPAEEESKNFA